ncbi:hypothetical protein P308_02225 [Pseudomonas piscis]|nr:hypothetical protein P308_02225 [Pseudomonas piscis]
MLPSESIFEYTPKPASQILREYSSTFPIHELPSFSVFFLPAIPFSLMFTRDTFEQCGQLIELSRECLNVMFRRNADTIQGTGDARIKSLLDFIQLHFDPTFKSSDIPLDAIDLTVGRLKLFSHNFFAFLFNGLTSLDQLLEVVATFLADFGIGAQAS